MFPESLPVQEASGSGKQVAHSPRALFVDTDPYTQVYIQNKYPPLCAIPPRNVHIDKHVITAGDYHIALENLNESSDKLIDLIRSKLEGWDKFQGVQFICSVNGGTGAATSAFLS